MSLISRINNKIGRALLVLVGFLFLLAIVFLAVNVARNIQNLGSAQSDNMQWTLAQAEVEFLEYARQLDRDPADAKQVRRRFDVFYSRINTIEQGRIFAQLRETPKTSAHLGAVRIFLTTSAQIVDQGDDTLLDNLTELQLFAAETRWSVRQLAKSGIEVFAQQSLQQRGELSRTITQLALALLALFSGLFLSLIFLNRLNTALQSREQERSHTATRMNTVIETALDGVIVSDVSGKIMEFNPAAEEIFGHFADDVIGHDIGDVIVPDHLRGAHSAGMDRMRASGERRVVGKGRVQLEGMRANGDSFPVELALKSAMTAEGEIFIAFLRDISKQVADEQELVEARDKALASEKLKTNFLATMSHEIRTPLNGLLGNLNLLRDTRLSKEQERLLGYMDASGRLLRSHISDVLDITRYDAGKMDIRKEPVNISKLIEDLINNQSGTAVEHETSLSWGWKGEAMPWILSDPDRLQHVVMNLVGNAVKFTKRGRVNVTVSATDGNMTFEIADTGVGIPEDTLPRIFDDFVIGTGERNREIGGTGLGLGIAKRFVEALGGEIMAQSIEGEGSLFTVTLPVEAVDAPEADKTPKPKRVPLGPMHILLVEDNEINLNVARDMLVYDGHTVVEAYNGQEALEKVQTESFDLILMDINMPVMDGREASTRIRQLSGPSSRVPIVALTANAMESDQSELLKDGMDAVLTKPLSRDALRDALADRHTPKAAPQEDFVVKAQSNEARMAMGEQAFARLSARFVQEVDALVQWLEEDGEHDFLEIARRCHEVAGSASVFGAVKLRKTLIGIENAAKAGDSAKVNADLASLPAICDGTKAQLNETFPAT